MSQTPRLLVGKEGEEAVAIAQQKTGYLGEIFWRRAAAWLSEEQRGDTSHEDPLSQGSIPDTRSLGCVGQ